MKLIPILLLLPTLLTAQIRLTEVAPTNTGQLNDEDGDRPDWIELHNYGVQAVNLYSWGISDGGSANRWLLPEINLEPGNRLLILASGKNRGGISTPLNGIDHWETAVYESNQWHYRVGTQAPPADWNLPDFNPAGWTLAPGGFGYGDGDDATTVPSGTITVYYRYNFNISHLTDLKAAVLSMDYDDGFVAYLNGQEIARSSNISGTPTHTTLAVPEREATGLPAESFVINPIVLSNSLTAGNNVLAVEIHNTTASSSDLSGRSWLYFGVGSTNQYFGATPSWFNPNSGPGSSILHTDFKLNFSDRVTLFDPSANIVDSVSIGVLQPGHARMRLNDDGDWCTTATPTPNATNGWNCEQGYAAQPTFILPAGFYSGPQTIGIAGNGIIRYTTDGSIPDNTDPLYDAPFQVSNTTLVRARQFEFGKLPSAIASASYLIDDPTTLPVVSIALPPSDFTEVYDNYSRKGVLSVEYFDKNREKQFSGEFAGYVVGNWSVSFPQKSLQFDAEEEYGSLGEINYPLFAPDKPIEQLHGFRIRNEDDDWIQARMRDRIVNELAAPTHAARASYRNVAAFINGEYWGHYSMRERLDNYFVRDNYGANPDSVNMVKTHYGQGDYVAEYGTIDDFFAMSDFIWDNDMSDPAQFQQAGELLDLNNFTDYMQTEVYVSSTDWLQDYFNNFRLFKTRKNAPWKFLLWDVSYSSGNPLGGSACASCDVLGTTLSNDSRYARMLRSLLDNPEYRRHFINRFADLMNTSFSTSRAHSLINSNAAELGPEIDRHHERWGTGNFSNWSTAVQVLRDFYSERPDFQRQHIIDHFELENTVNITLDVQPPGAGTILISTVIPETLPWTGVYFHGNPVTVTAIANPGFTFSNWSNNAFITDPAAISFTTDVANATNFTANFIGESEPLQLVVSEINYHSEPTRDGGDWFEIRNEGSSTVDLSHFTLQDKAWYHRFTVPAGTVIGAGGHLVFCENPTKFTAEYVDVDNLVSDRFTFELSDQSDEIRLFDRLGNVATWANYEDASPWPLTPDGFGLTLERRDGAPELPSSWFAGCVGGTPGRAYSPCVESGYLSEINYHAADNQDGGDWFELHNPSNAPLDLSGWQIRDNDDSHIYEIPAGTVLEPSAPYRVLYEDEAKFASVYPNLLNKTGPIGFGLGNSTDMIRLYQPDGRLFLCVQYFDGQGWPEAADGEGYTLEKLEWASLFNEAASWEAGCLGGSPGVAYDPDCGISGATDMDALAIRVWPNPANDYVMAEIADGYNGRLEMTDLFGRTVSTALLVNGNARFSVVQLPRGVYVIRGGAWSARVILK